MSSGIAQENIQKKKQYKEIATISKSGLGGALCGFLCGLAIDYSLGLPRHIVMDRSNQSDGFKIELNLPRHTFRLGLAIIGSCIGAFHAIIQGIQK